MRATPARLHQDHENWIVLQPWQHHATNIRLRSLKSWLHLKYPTQKPLEDPEVADVRIPSSYFYDGEALLNPLQNNELTPHLHIVLPEDLEKLPELLKLLDFTNLDSTGLTCSVIPEGMVAIYDKAANCVILEIGLAKYPKVHGRHWQRCSHA